MNKLGGTMEKILDELRAMVSESNQATTARKLGVSRAMINGLLRGRFVVTSKFAKKFGYRKVVTWEKIEE